MTTGWFLVACLALFFSIGLGLLFRPLFLAAVGFGLILGLVILELKLVLPR